MSRTRHISDEDASPSLSRSRARDRWRTAIGPIPLGYRIHHKDGNPKNNSLENLECITRYAHLSAHMKEKCGERNSNFRTGKYTGAKHCACGTVKDFRSKQCARCAKRSYPVRNQERTTYRG